MAYTVYAPDWTWQKCRINILVVLDNPGPDTLSVETELVFPQDRRSHFTYEDGDAPEQTSVPVELPPGSTTRTAFTNIEARDGVPCQTYDFALVFRTSGAERRVPYPVRTIRGQAFSGGKAVAVLVPSIVALVWCIAFWFALRKFAARGAWKRPGVPMEPLTQTETWIDKE